MKDQIKHNYNPNTLVRGVKKLLKAKADPNAPDDGGFTPLMRAAFKSNREIVHLLIENHADPNMVTDLQKTPALVLATLERNITVVTALTQCGAGLNVTDEQGMTA